MRPRDWTPVVDITLSPATSRLSPPLKTDLESVMRNLWPTLLLATALGCNGGNTGQPSTVPNTNAEPPAPTAEPPPPTSAHCTGPAPGNDFECVQDCGPPVASSGDPEPGWRWLSAADAKNRKQFGCPICLPEDARIATPHGEVPISRLVQGAVVWSTRSNGQRVERRVLHVLSVAAPARHRLAVIELEDGRRLRASPGHPDAEGGPLGKLAPGDSLDGSRVRSTSQVPYIGRTFDLVLEHRAWHYFADGVRVRSSLAPSD